MARLELVQDILQLYDPRSRLYVRRYSPSRHEHPSLRALTAAGLDDELDRFEQRLLEAEFAFFSSTGEERTSIFASLATEFELEEQVANQLEQAWNGEAERERIRYQSWAWQLGRDIAESFFFFIPAEKYQIASFRAWADRCLDELKSLEHQAGTLSGDRATDILNRRTAGGPLSFNEEYVASSFEDRIRPLAQSEIDSLKLAVLQSIFASELDKDACLRGVLNTVKDRLRCEVADYLEAGKEEHGGSFLRLTDTSAREPTGTPEKMSAVREYKAGEGLTGSALLASVRIGQGMTGSNSLKDSEVLEGDPRASRIHQDSYEIVFKESLPGGRGKIVNFWVFPIFSQDEEAVVAALRIMNRLGNDGNVQLGGFPADQRRLVRALADELSKYWKKIKEMPRLEADGIARYQHRAEAEELAKQLSGYRASAALQTVWPELRRAIAGGKES